jgi:hypothetical protein
MPTEEIQMTNSLVVLVLLAATSLSVSTGLMAQEIPSIKSAILNAQVASANGVLRYAYTLTNSPSSSGAVSSLRVDISQPVGTVTLRGSGLDSGPGFMAANSSSIIAEPTAVPLIPVGAYAPVNWIATVTIDGKLMWGAIDESDVVAPSKTTNGFQITTYGLPSIRDFQVKPLVDFNSLPLTEPTPATLPQYYTSLQALLGQISFAGKTIAPTAPPLTFEPVQFIGTIRDFTAQAFQEGWITDGGILRSLQAKLDSASVALNRNDDATATNVLGAFINEVNAQSGKHLTSEAVALLFFNARYELAQLTVNK